MQIVIQQLEENDVILGNHWRPSFTNILQPQELPIPGHRRTAGCGLNSCKFNQPQDVHVIITILVNKLSCASFLQDHAILKVSLTAEYQGMWLEYVQQLITHHSAVANSAKYRSHSGGIAANVQPLECLMSILWALKYRRQP